MAKQFAAIKARFSGEAIIAIKLAFLMKQLPATTTLTLVLQPEAEFMLAVGTLK
ncbi:hypothetical protein JCGZ_15457 [Jatropha curcas]|uniref:Uncharacterized protein n=1 Tax=Jatropha curcas TaxID=180498 RepID=A0A067LBX3_JATCU|nr:hypothetical protein JCGZ_15457 [Jatropha curcas]